MKIGKITGDTKVMESEMNDFIDDEELPRDIGGYKPTYKSLITNTNWHVDAYSMLPDESEPDVPYEITGARTDRPAPMQPPAQTMPSQTMPDATTGAITSTGDTTTTEMMPVGGIANNIVGPGTANRNLLIAAIIIALLIGAYIVTKKPKKTNKKSD